MKIKADNKEMRMKIAALESRQDSDEQENPPGPNQNSNSSNNGGNDNNNSSNGRTFRFNQRSRRVPG